MTKLSVLIATCLILSLAACAGKGGNNSLNAAQQREADVAKVMKKVADWQLANLRHKDTVWQNAVLYAGIMALYQSTRDEKYFNAVMSMGERNDWKLGPRERHADDHCIGQVYLELYFIRKDPKMIEDVRNTFDSIISNPKPGRADWSWCDALFMAPACMAKLAAATNKMIYLDVMDTMWWDTVDYLYDKREHLFFRDENFLNAVEKNGKKIFWGRGNGWVLAGVVRVLQYMPENYPTRARYLDLYRQISNRIATLQREDGFWKSSLLDPESYPDGESSCTALFTYALAWGINQHVLSREDFFQVTNRGWKALLSALEDSGKVGWVQQPDHRPNVVQKENSETYGTGAFFLAGSEIMKLYSHSAY